MILPLPKQFDANEWFILLTTSGGYLALYFLPKRYPHAISVLLVMFVVSSAIIYDHTVAVPPLDMYDINDWNRYELMDVVTYFMYSPYALICVFVYDRVDPKGLWFSAYVAVWSLFCVGFEWLSLRCHVFKFHKWTFFYSLSVYLVMTTLLLYYFRYLIRRSKKPAAS